MSKDVEAIVDRVSWMSWDEKMELFRALTEYVGEPEVGATLAEMEEARRRRLQIIDGRIVSFTFRNRDFSFFVECEKDTVQTRHFYDGTFYDLKGLAIIERYVPQGGTFLDVGANVGNHAIYAAGLLNVRRVIPIEPNPRAIRLLKHNVRLNDLTHIVDLRFLGVGLSNAKGRAAAHTPGHYLSATHLSPDPSCGAIPLDTGDSLLGDESVDFIKIDVERMELEALQGLKGTIQKFRPTMYVEVDDANASLFHDFLTAINYRVVERYKQWAANENFMVLPK